MKIAQLTQQHALDYLELRQTSEVEYPEYVGPSAERELLAGPDNISSLLTLYSQEGTLIFGAFDDNKLIGTLAVSRKLSPKFKHRGFIWGMYVRKEYRQLHVGEKLIKHVKSWADNHDEVKVLWLQVTESNLPAISFYKKHDFELYGTEPLALFAQEHYHAVHYMQLAV